MRPRRNIMAKRIVPLLLILVTLGVLALGFWRFPISQNGSYRTATSPSVPASSEPTMDTVSYRVSEEFILNPERGFYSPVDNLLSAPGLNGIRTEGNTLIRSYIRLDEWRDTDL